MATTNYYSANQSAPQQPLSAWPNQPVPRFNPPNQQPLSAWPNQQAPQQAVIPWPNQGPGTSPTQVLRGCCFGIDGSEWQKKSDDEIREIWLTNLERMFPDFSRENIVQFLIHRERYVEPLHGLNEIDLVPEVKTPVSNLFLASTSQIYPALTNGESVSRHAREASNIIIKN